VNSHTESSILYKRAFLLAVFTIVYNIAEGVIATFFGYKDESLTLFGFGVDSFIEVISGIGIAHMITRIKLNPDITRDQYERTALRLTGFSFYALTLGLLLSGIYNLIKGQTPQTTFAGIILSLISIITMLLLIRGKVRVGKALNSQAIIADAQCTRVCVTLSLVLLIASCVYELTRIPFIDILGALGLAYFSLNEGRECFEKAASEALCSCEHD
jgi:divalent metal cation (Fe/Co/Zn/Cd) transporter